MKKTYKKTVPETVIEEPRLVIQHDQFATNPRRENTNLGYFITVDRSYHSPDQNKALEDIVKDTGEEASSLEFHIALIKDDIETNLKEKVLAIYPVNKYEHGSIDYKRGTAQGFDYSNNGFYIITDKTHKEMPEKKSEWERIIDDELETYNRYANGEVYSFELYDEQGEYQDGGGDYTLENIESGLPEGFLEQGDSIMDYLIN